MSRKTYKIVGISILVLSMSFLIKEETKWSLNTTIVDMFVVPGEVDYNVSGNINLWTVTGNIIDTTLTGSFSTGSFRAKDLSGVYYAGTRYWKISSSQMTWSNGWVIPLNTYYVIRPNPTTAVTFSGTTSTGANIISSSWRLSIGNLQQQPIMTLTNNSWFLYRASITPSIAMTVPAGQQVGNYRAVLTVTVPWSS